MSEPHPFFEKLATTLKKAAAALGDANVDFMLGGSMAAWAVGGPPPHRDLDFMVRPADVERGMEALEEIGMRREDPTENWLVKAWDGEVLVDLIFRPSGLPLDDEVFSRAERVNVLGQEVPVMAIEDVIATQLLSMNDHRLDYETPVMIARAVREQINWAALRRRTLESPYAAAFFTLVEELGVAPAPEVSRGSS
jgi:hypothetical protein